MTVKQLLVYAVIFLAVVLTSYFGYTGYRTWQVADFVRTSDSMPDSRSLGEAFAFVRTAPVMVCKMSSSDFNSSTNGTMYFYKGMIRTDIVYLSVNNSVLHMVYDSAGLHIWKDGDLTSSLVTTEALAAQPVDPSLFSTKDCSVWWNPDDSLFVYPPTGARS